MTETTIAIKERINEKKARMHTLGKWEMDKAIEIQHLIRQQSVLYDEICELEIELAKARAAR